MTRTLCVVGAFAIGILVTACSRSDAGKRSPTVDAAVVAFLSEARALHHQANIHEANNDLPAAIHAVEQLVAAHRPHPDRKVPEVEEVVADGYARLAELTLRTGALQSAATAARNGLNHAVEPTYFRGHLVEMQGLVAEAEGARLADAGAHAEAEIARQRALRFLEEVVKIQQQVVERATATERTP